MSSDEKCKFLEKLGVALAAGGYSAALKLLSTAPESLMKEFCATTGFEFEDIQKDIKENAEIYGAERKSS